MSRYWVVVGISMITQILMWTGATLQPEHVLYYGVSSVFVTMNLLTELRDEK